VALFISGTFSGYSYNVTSGGGGGGGGDDDALSEIEKLAAEALANDYASSIGGGLLAAMLLICVYKCCKPNKRERQPSRHHLDDYEDPALLLDNMRKTRGRKHRQEDRADRVEMPRRERPNSAVLALTADGTPIVIDPDTGTARIVSLPTNMDIVPTTRGQNTYSLR